MELWEDAGIEPLTVIADPELRTYEVIERRNTYDRWGERVISSVTIVARSGLGLREAFGILYAMGCSKGDAKGSTWRHVADADGRKVSLEELYAAEVGYATYAANCADREFWVDLDAWFMGGPTDSRTTGAQG